MITVVVNVLNGARFIKSLRSNLDSQTYRSFSIIFLDNCSTDNTIDLIYSEFKHYDIRVIRLFKTLPLYEARNIALSHVKTSLCAFLDVDDLWHPLKLHLQINTYKTNPNYFLYSTNFSPFNPKKKIPLQSSSFTLPLYKPYQLPYSNRNVYNLSVSSFMLNLDMRPKATDNLFDPIYMIIGDFDLAMRFQHSHFTVPFVLTYVFTASSSTTWRNLDLYYDELSHWLAANNDSLNTFAHSCLNRDLKYLGYLSMALKSKSSLPLLIKFLFSSLSLNELNLRLRALYKVFDL